MWRRCLNRNGKFRHLVSPVLKIGCSLTGASADAKHTERPLRSVECNIVNFADGELHCCADSFPGLLVLIAAITRRASGSTI
jgi:hypothetical protein